MASLLKVPRCRYPSRSDTVSWSMRADQLTGILAIRIFFDGVEHLFEKGQHTGRAGSCRWQMTAPKALSDDKVTQAELVATEPRWQK